MQEPGDGQGWGRVVPAPNSKIWGAQRPAEHGAQVLRVLAGGAGLDGEVAAVVRARRDLVQQQLAVAQQEHFHSKDARACSAGTGDSRGSITLLTCVLAS